ncbi:MAG: Fis family transcriptional regulator [Betaproteobacteria bacterium RIFCSPLOWO2_12_FULL_63_13]|nr:MAG: Fis family transcriptional regulator [Betaproteobacteria bacterium RIFCSPLOWO2_12_FULL_63_13]
MAETRLKGAEREFFTTLDRIAYANPFSDRRARLIQQLVPAATIEDLAGDREALARLVEPRLHPFSDAAALNRLDAADQRLVESAFLYVCYHRHVPPIDELIERQAAHGEAPSVDRVARSVIGELVGRGLGEESAARHFALFFQLRRAFHFIVRSLAGECESMRTLRRALWSNIFTDDMRAYRAGLWNRMEDFSTLLLGETGTGKGLAAAAIGRSEFIPFLADKRRFAANFTDSFIAINLSQFSEALIESELFGHRKGAFTGAIEHHEGVFERCSAHGALFLDEIGEVSVPVQIKLLQILQERSFNPVGSHERRRFAGRVIAATNRPLDELRAAGRFRDDFYYRLCSDVIRVPPLRQRIRESPGELEEMVRLLVARIAGEPSPALAAIAMEAIERDLPRDYRWPGNVRELEQAVRRILLTGRYAGDRDVAGSDENEAFVQRVRAGTLGAEELLGEYCTLLYKQHGTYEEVARRTRLDRRTAKKYVLANPVDKPSP